MRRQDNPYNLCHFEFSDGRQCCMPATDGNFCHSHAQLHRRRTAPVETDLSSELSACFAGADSNLDVHRALERVFQALSSNRITNRRAATLGYLGQLILLSKSGVDSQLLSKNELSRMCDVIMTLLRMKYPPESQQRTQSQPPQSAATGSPTVPTEQPRPRHQ
jgi:hypothetical protein